MMANASLTAVIQQPKALTQAAGDVRNQEPTMQACQGNNVGPSEPYWLPEHSEAATREGWNMFETQGSKNGPWQVQAFDDPTEAADACGLEIPRLRGDEDAWRLVFSGTEQHHIAARAFLQAHNPIELASIEKVGVALGKSSDS